MLCQLPRVDTDTSPDASDAAACDTHVSSNQFSKIQGTHNTLSLRIRLFGGVLQLLSGNLVIVIESITMMFSSMGRKANLPKIHSPIQYSHVGRVHLVIHSKIYCMQVSHPGWLASSMALSVTHDQSATLFTIAAWCAMQVHFRSLVKLGKCNRCLP